MIDMNKIIANNIFAILKSSNKKQTDLAEALGVSKQTINKMLNGARTINAGELRDIAQYLGTTMDKLTCIPANTSDTNISRAFMGKVQTDSAREALDIADKLSDMILFHKTVRENGTEMMKPWKDA